MGKNKQSTAKAMFDETNRYFDRYKNDRTRKAYIRNFRDFLRYCSTEMKCKTLSECGFHIQDYADYLVNQGRTASTIHTCIAPVCGYFGVNMSDIKKPLRYTSEYTRGRSTNGRKERADNDVNNPRYANTVMFQRAVGIRRNELKRLCGGDLVTDESGYLCVCVKRGKGGKRQLQRILPEHRELVKAYFDGKGAGEKIFSPGEFSNSVNYHALRAEHARTMYAYYTQRLNDEGDKYREQLIAEIEARNRVYHLDKKNGLPLVFDRSLVEGKYYLRGKNKAFALEHGLPVAYDKAAVMAVSVFSLSHWRNDVTVVSYLLAV